MPSLGKTTLSPVKNTDLVLFNGAAVLNQAHSPSNLSRKSRNTKQTSCAIAPAKYRDNAGTMIPISRKHHHQTRASKRSSSSPPQTHAHLLQARQMRTDANQYDRSDVKSVCSEIILDDLSNENDANRVISNMKMSLLRGMLDQGTEERTGRMIERYHKEQQAAGKATKERTINAIKSKRSSSYVSAAVTSFFSSVEKTVEANIAVMPPPPKILTKRTDAFLSIVSHFVSCFYSENKKSSKFFLGKRYVQLEEKNKDDEYSYIPPNKCEERYTFSPPPGRSRACENKINHFSNDNFELDGTSAKTSTPRRRKSNSDDHESVGPPRTISLIDGYGSSEQEDANDVFPKKLSGLNRFDDKINHSSNGNFKLDATSIIPLTPPRERLKRNDVESVGTPRTVSSIDDYDDSLENQRNLNEPILKKVLEPQDSLCMDHKKSEFERASLDELFLDSLVVDSASQLAMGLPM